MRAIPSCFRNSLAGGAIALLLLSGGCRPATDSATVRQFQVQQNWALQPGEAIAGHAIVAGLGDVSIALHGAAIYAPFDGTVAPAATEPCVIFSSPRVPAYLMRLCGIRRPRLGELERGDRIGTGRLLHFATLRKQPDGTWALVEPSLNLLESALTPP